MGFGYGAQAEPVITDLSIDIASGDHLAIVGPSGIGKSSLAGLLAGMLRPTAGEILLDGVPMARYPAAALTRLRVLIPQEAYVFAGTLAENILYLRGTTDPLPRAGLDAAADALGLSPLVSRLGGYHAVIDPAALSAGERQLIAITRAYLSTAPIAILDEASCYLDPAAEARAEAAFARRPGTLIVIAHRISSALRARRVLVLERRPRPGRRSCLAAGQLPDVPGSGRLLERCVAAGNAGARAQRQVTRAGRAARVVRPQDRGDGGGSARPARRRRNRPPGSATPNGCGCRFPACCRAR